MDASKISKHMYLIKPPFLFFLQEEIKIGYEDYATEDENTIFVEKVNISLHFLSDQMSLKVRGNNILCSLVPS